MKKIFLLMIISTIMLCNHTNVSAYADIQDEELDIIASGLKSIKVMEGYDDGYFHLDDKVTRSQFAKMIIYLSGSEDEIEFTSRRNYFTDVDRNHWANVYVNAAFKEGLVNGCGGGIFMPDRGVTLGEAVTVALRMLEYDEADIGYVWPEDYIEIAKKLELTNNITKSGDEVITRLDALYLFSALLSSDTKLNKPYIGNISSSYILDSVILDYDSESVWVHTGEKEVKYPLNTTLSDSLISGVRGTLLKDENGEVNGFIPNSEKRVTIKLKEVTSDSITDIEGYSYDVLSSAVIQIGNNKYSYGASYNELKNCSTLTLCYDDKGNIDFIIASYNTFNDGYIISGVYENAYPNTKAAEKVTVMGITFDINTEISKEFLDFNIGEKITLNLDKNNKIVDVSSYNYKESDTIVGILGDNKVTLLNGLIINSDIETNEKSGTLVKVTQNTMGKVYASRAQNTTSKTLDVKNMTLGNTPLDENILVYESIGENKAVQIALGDIENSQVDGEDISYYHINKKGNVDIILLNDVTGNLYTYGIIDIESYTVGEGENASKEYTLSIEHEKGKTKAIKNSLYTNYNNKPAGIILNEDGTIESFILLRELTDITRSDINGEESISCNDETYKISKDVLVYNKITDTWTTLDIAKGFSDKFEAYYDKDLKDGGMIRFIYVY